MQSCFPTSPAKSCAQCLDSLTSHVVTMLLVTWQLVTSLLVGPRTGFYHPRTIFSNCWPAQPTPEKPRKYCIYAMIVAYVASQGSHWLPVKLSGHPRAAKLMFKASKMLVRGSKLVLGQPSQPLKKHANTSYVLCLCHLQLARVPIGSQRRSQGNPEQQN